MVAAPVSKAGLPSRGEVAVLKVSTSLLPCPQHSPGPGAHKPQLMIFLVLYLPNLQRLQDGAAPASCTSLQGLPLKLRPAESLAHRDVDIARLRPGKPDYPLGMALGAEPNTGRGLDLDLPQVKGSGGGGRGSHRRHSGNAVAAVVALVAAVSSTWRGSGRGLRLHRRCLLLGFPGAMVVFDSACLALRHHRLDPARHLPRPWPPPPAHALRCPGSRIAAGGLLLHAPPPES